MGTPMVSARFQTGPISGTALRTRIGARSKLTTSTAGARRTSDGCRAQASSSAPYAAGASSGKWKCDRSGPRAGLPRVRCWSGTPRARYTRTRPRARTSRSRMPLTWARHSPLTPGRRTPRPNCFAISPARDTGSSADMWCGRWLRLPHSTVPARCGESFGDRAFATPLSHLCVARSCAHRRASFDPRPLRPTFVQRTPGTGGRRLASNGATDWRVEPRSGGEMIRWTSAVSCALVASLGGATSMAEARAVSLTGTVGLTHYDLQSGAPSERFWALDTGTRFFRLQPRGVDLAALSGRRARSSGDLHDRRV